MFFIKDVKYKNIIDIKYLHIKKHRITCIVGESGSGKTTLLKLLNKLISYDSGEILYNNQSLNNIDSIELRRNIGMLSQFPAIFTGNIRENLLIGLKFSEKPRVSDDKLYEILNLVNLSKTLNEDTKNLSGGEKQRLALGRLMLIEPEVLLLDEPSSSLDENTEDIIIRSLVDYTKKNNKTLIMVTHSTKVANTFSDEIVKMKKGMIIN